MPKRKPKDPCQQIYDALTDYGLDEVRRHTKPPQRIRASEASKCPRQIYYRLKGMRPAPRDAQLYQYGIGGDVDHDICRQMLDHHGVPVEGVTFLKSGEVEEDSTIIKHFDVPGPDGEPVQVCFSARADGILPETPRGRCLLEIKGIGFWYMKYLVGAYTMDGHEVALKRIHDKHLAYEWQAEVTMRLFGEELTYLMLRDRAGAGMGVYNSLDGKRSGIYIQSTELRWKEILKQAAYIFRCLKRGKPPVKQYAAKATECSQCSFFYLCHGADKRREKGQEPAILYPGPQIDIFEEDNQ